MSANARKIGSAFGIAAIVGLSIAMPASAATFDAEYGFWSEEGTITFTDPAFIDATWSMQGAEYYYPTQTDSSGEYFTDESPIGAVFGASGPSAETNYLHIETLDDTSTTAELTIEFDSPVPANSLAIAVSDIDSDHATVSMLDADGNPLTSDQIIGSAENVDFNFCDVSVQPTSCAADENTPTIVENSDSVILGDVGDADAWGTDGASAWLRPSVAVSQVTVAILNEDTDGYSSERVWVAQRSEKLAATGLSDTIYIATVAASVLITVGGLTGLRRRRS